MTILRDVGELRTGYQLRGALDPIPEGPHRVVLLGDIQDEGIDWNSVRRTQLRERAEDFIGPRDIIIRSRGAHYGVLLVIDPPAGTVVAAPLFLLSVRRSDVLPEYLAWYLNRPTTHRVLENMARGTSLPTISIRELGELEIPVPPFEVQRKTVEIVDLLQTERHISSRLLELRAQLADVVLGGMAMGRVAIKPMAAVKPIRRLTIMEDE